MSFWKNLRAVYRGSWRTMIALPLLALVPVVFELIQHVVEVQIGMYNSIEAAKAVEHHPARMAMGLVKVVAITIPVYWTARFLATSDRRFASHFDSQAMRLFGLVLLFQTAMAALQMFVLPQTATVVLVGMVLGFPIAALLAAWYVAAPLGNPRIGPVRSTRMMAPVLVSTILISFIAMLPLMIVHYGLAALALLGPKTLLWPTLIVDSLLVGWLSSILAATVYVVAARAADRAGVALLDRGDVSPPPLNPQEMPA